MSSGRTLFLGEYVTGCCNKNYALSSSTVLNSNIRFEMDKVWLSYQCIVHCHDQCRDQYHNQCHDQCHNQCRNQCHNQWHEHQSVDQQRLGYKLSMWLRLGFFCSGRRGCTTLWHSTCYWMTSPVHLFIVTAIHLLTAVMDCAMVQLNCFLSLSTSRVISSIDLK